MAEDVEQEVPEQDEDDDFLKAIFGEDEEDAGDEEEVEEEVEREYTKQDKREEKVLVSRLEKLEKRDSQREIDRALDKFDEKADPVAKEWFAVMRTGREDLKQLKGLMELANQKASALATKQTPSEEVEEAARKLAADAWGIGPVKGGGPGKSDLEKLEAAAKAGDSHAAFLLFQNAPPGA